MALKNLDDKVDGLPSGIQWVEAAKSLPEVPEMTGEELVGILAKLDSKGIKFGDDQDQESVHLAQQWIGRGLNWLADKARGVGEWAGGKMEDARIYQQIQMGVKGIQDALNLMLQNPKASVDLLQQVKKQTATLEQTVKSIPSLAPAGAAPAGATPGAAGTTSAGAAPAGAIPHIAPVAPATAGAVPAKGCPPGANPTPDGRCIFPMPA